jgi:hypothetical protein
VLKVAIGTDGASNMIAANGMGGIMCREASFYALLLHCTAHRLPLALKDSNNIFPWVAKMEGLFGKLHSLTARSGKRKAALRDWCEQLQVLSQTDAISSPR